MIVACALALAACGGDDEPKPASTSDAPPATETAPAKTGERTQTEAERTDSTPPPGGAEHGGREEDQPGGAGDEEEARVQAQLTGRKGRITPRQVSVPPFLAIRVELRSADGGDYGLRVGGKVLRVGGAVSSATAEIDGLRPGASTVATPLGRGGNAVRIVANAEPGP